MQASGIWVRWVLCAATVLLVGCPESVTFPTDAGGDADVGGDTSTDSSATDSSVDVEDTSVSTETRCDDGIDDDGDGATDCDDVDCAGDPDCAVPVERCGNGADDDRDGLADCDDPDCAENPRCVPESDCDDGRDNDRDGVTDCDDADCARDSACATPAERCGNGVDDDRDGLADCDDPDCAENPRCVPESSCDDGRDNDRDGATDCDDADCARDSACAPPAERCGDGVDNDLDGLVDCDDPDCAARPRCATSREICDDGRDNDGDDHTDCADADCHLDPVCDFVEICDNERDDDADGTFDCEDLDCAGDPACVGARDEICDNGIDDDRDGRIDCADLDCNTDPACSVTAERCDDGRDNDGDGRTDCEDEDCDDSPACTIFEVCDNGRDDDGDARVDCADPDCADTTTCGDDPPDVLPELTRDMFGTTCVPEADLWEGARDMGHHDVFLYLGSIGDGPVPLWHLDNRALATGMLDLDTFVAPAAGRYIVEGYSHFYREIDGCYRAADIEGGGPGLDGELYESYPRTRVFDADAGELFYLGFADVTNSSAVIDQTVRRVRATEVCDDGVDNDGDLLPDCTDRECRDTRSCRARTFAPIEWGAREDRCDAFLDDTISPDMLSVIEYASDVEILFEAPISGNYRIRMNNDADLVAIRGECAGPAHRADESQVLTFTALAGEVVRIYPRCVFDCSFTQAVIEPAD